MHEIKCISSLLGLFQHLSFAYQSTTPRYSINSIEKITGHTKLISSYFTQKLGKQTVKVLLKQNLAKLLNTMSPLFLRRYSSSEGNIQFFPLINEILEMDLSYCVRERVTRDSSFAEKQLEQTEKLPVELSVVLTILKTFASRNTTWFKKNQPLADRLVKKLNGMDVTKNEKDFETIVMLLVAFADRTKTHLNPVLAGQAVQDQVHRGSQLPSYLLQV